MSDPVECANCGIELGEGPEKCRRAVGTDICLECAFNGEWFGEQESDPEGECSPLTMDDMESPSFRAAMMDAGRGHLLR